MYIVLHYSLYNVVQSLKLNIFTPQYSILRKVQGTNARKVNCGRVYSASILKPVLSGLNL